MQSKKTLRALTTRSRIDIVTQVDKPALSERLNSDVFSCRLKTGRDGDVCAKIGE